MGKQVFVANYDPAWVTQFHKLHDEIWPHVRDIAIKIEHVGSTSVPGLAAKPVIDLDIVIPSPNELSLAVERLACLGYRHRGNLGIEGREAFRAAPHAGISHNLYVCINGSLALRNHLLLRDHLRSHPADAREYSVLKERLALQYPDDMDRYIEGKTSFILEILRRNGIGIEESAAIEEANRVHTAER